VRILVAFPNYDVAFYVSQAVYQADNLGHFVELRRLLLTLRRPIRRYPDLLVHRCDSLFDSWEGRPDCVRRNRGSGGKS